MSLTRNHNYSRGYAERTNKGPEAPVATIPAQYTKGLKGHPVTCHAGQREYRGRALLILNLDIRWMVNATFRPFYSWKRDSVTIVQEAGWTPGPVWTGVVKIKFLPRNAVRIPNIPANNDSLCRLRYPGTCTVKENRTIFCVQRFHTCYLKNVSVRAMKAFGGLELQFFSFLTSTLDGDEWSASWHSRFNPGSSYSKSQRDALFLKFILIKHSTCFGQIYCPSSGVSTLYTQK